jgi:hypothetical protein
VKQGEVAKNHAMRAFVNIPSHSSHGGEVIVVGKLVSCYLHYLGCKFLVYMFFHVYVCVPR